MKTDFHTVHERLRYLAGDLGLPEDATLEDIMAELQRLQAEEGEIPEEGQALSKSKEKGGTDMKSLPKALQGKKPEEIRAMSLPDLVKLFTEGEVPKVEDLKAAFQDEGLAAIAAALGLGEGATAEDIVAAIQALVETAKAAKPEGEGGEMKTELTKAGNRIAVLEGEKSVREWEDKTRDFKAIPGTAHDHAVALAGIETKAGKDAATTQFEALKEANRLAEEALKIVGTSRTAGPTDFDNEVAKHMTANPTATKVDAIKAVSKARPDLYFARRQ